MKNGKIGIFDSGIGGVTVLSEILKLLPNEEYIYYSDSKNNPYGEIDDNKLLEICCEIIDYFISNDCKAVVIACNTASAKCSERLRKIYKNILIIAIEPAYKSVYDFAYEKRALVMATPGTISSKKFNILYNKYNNNNTQLLPCKNLAYMIENDDKNLNTYLNNLLEPYKNKIDVVVLGCTHYPLIKNKIEKILGNVIFFDGAIGLSRYLKKLLIKNNLLNDKKVGNIEFLDSSNSEIKRERFFCIINKTN